MRKFVINFDKDQFDDLRDRIKSSRFPSFKQIGDWSLGTPDTKISGLLEYWANYDWKSQENYLNQFPQFICDIDGIDIHFFHIKSEHPNAMPILMAHGWPDSFLRYSKTFPLLKDFNLIVPSIPGFGFSSLPQKGYVNNSDTAEVWHKLMTKILGYSKFIATGGDMGRGVLFYIASNHPENILGLYLTDVGYAGSIVASPDNELSSTYLKYKQDAIRWMQREGAYINIQSTKPYSLGYGFCDSPVGMASWMIEKFHDWTDWERFSIDDLLNNLTLYWMTNCMASSITAYYGNTFTIPPLGKITSPIGVARFPHDILPVPKEWIEANYNVVHFSEMPYGGHFTAMEAPEPFAADLTMFIDKII